LPPKSPGETDFRNLGNALSVKSPLTSSPSELGRGGLAFDAAAPASATGATVMLGARGSRLGTSTVIVAAGWLGATLVDGATPG
jgi:hypothetical protein